MTATDDRLLRIYLQDHVAAADAGVRLLERCRRANAHEWRGAVLAEIEAEVIDDRTTLMAIVDRFGWQPNPIKSAVARVGELAGRLKLNGRIGTPSPSSTVVELEALMAGVVAKRHLWSALRAVASSRPELDEAVLDELITRAGTQADRLTALHAEAALEAFAPTAEPAEATSG